MDPKSHRVIIIIMTILLLILLGGLIYSILSTNSRVASLNYVIQYEVAKQKKEQLGRTATQTALESSITENQKKYDDLNLKYQETQKQISGLTAADSTIRKRLMCSSTIPIVDYTNDGTVSTALKEFTSDYKVTDDHYEAVQKNARITFHNLKSSRTQSFFMVYFADPENGRVNGIFDILGQCWVNLNNQ
jgi:uncharacterized protein YxeA